MLELDSKYAPPLSNAHLVLVFRDVRLPDRRMNVGGLPIGVEVATDRLQWDRRGEPRV
jgi:hypothetical protein